MIETLSILSTLITRFPAQLASITLTPPPVATFTPLLAHPRPVVRKRAIVTLSQFVPHAEQPSFDDLLNGTILPGLRSDPSSSSTLEQQRTIIQLVTAIAKLSPGRLINSIDSIAPSILKACAKEDDELREYALQALEVIVLRCPSEVSPFLGQIVQTGTKLIKYDPNYAGDDDEDTEMDDLEDEDDEDNVNYSDDEDTSYKIRRSATKLLAALIETRPEMLSSLYKDVSPVLIQRFGDREEAVRLEVWATYGTLLNQTKVYGGLPQSSEFADSPGVGGKRKRTPSMQDGMDVESPESPAVLLKAQTPSLAKALLSQMRSAKTPSTVLQAAFNLLNNLVDVLPGSLTANAEPIASSAQSVLKQPLTTSSVTLHTTCLNFLTSFFSSHPASVFSSTSNLVPALLKHLNERHPRVITATFRTFSALLNMLRPVDASAHSDWVSSVYDSSVVRLSNPSTDAEVRQRAEVCMGDLWVNAADIVKSKGGKEWDAMCRTSGSVENAVRVVTTVAKEVDVGDAWLTGCVDWLLGVLKKSGKAGKGDAFTCLEVLLRK
jgi:cullin-associated NEDD8-dissociated protein 1